MSIVILIITITNTVHTHVYVYIYIYIYNMYLYLCIYIYIYTYMAERDLGASGGLTFLLIRGARASDRKLQPWSHSKDLISEIGSSQVPL